MKLALALLATLLFTYGCSSSRFHEILGTTYGFSGRDIAVQSDITVSGLRIRYSKVKTTDTCSSGTKDLVEISGPIGPDSVEVIERLLSKMSTCNGYGPTIYLNSGGGLLRDGFRLGYLFRKYSVFTVVENGQTCASACALAFLGGQSRTINGDGKLVFHAPYHRSALTGEPECIAKSNAGELRSFGIAMIGQKDGQYLFDRTMSSCSTSDGWTINRDAAKLFGIAHHGN